MIVNNFIGGISWAIGATIGLAIVIMLLGFVTKNVGLVPVVGDFIVEVNKYTSEVRQNDPRMLK